jgi:hypothetical protein
MKAMCVIPNFFVADEIIGLCRTAEKKKEHSAVL